MNPTTSYKPTATVRTPKRKPRKPQGITVPILLTADTGIHVVNSLTGTRYKIWYHVAGKKRYVTLPPKTTVDEARTRRDNLYENLVNRYGAKRRTPKEAPQEPKTHIPRISPGDGRYIYRRHPWIVKIKGKQICEARTKLEAEMKRDQWLRDNADKVPHVMERRAS